LPVLWSVSVTYSFPDAPFALSLIADLSMLLIIQRLCRGQALNIAPQHFHVRRGPPPRCTAL